MKMSSSVLKITFIGILSLAFLQFLAGQTNKWETVELLFEFKDPNQAKEKPSLEISSNRVYARIHYVDSYPWERGGGGNSRVFELDCGVNNWDKGRITGFEASDGIELVITAGIGFQQKTIVWNNRTDFSRIKNGGFDTPSSIAVRYQGKNTCISKINDDLNRSSIDRITSNGNQNNNSPYSKTPSDAATRNLAKDYLSISYSNGFNTSSVTIENTHKINSILVTYEVYETYKNMYGGTESRTCRYRHFLPPCGNAFNYVCSHSYTNASITILSAEFSPNAKGQITGRLSCD